MKQAKRDKDRRRNNRWGGGAKNDCMSERERKRQNLRGESGASGGVRGVLGVCDIESPES